tara:strand:+ start:302 stop:637 length:336 start_codon:yes stop_codon:yes gene_type:complete
MSQVSKNQWKVNYLYRLQQICTKDLQPHYNNKLEPENKEREVQRISLRDYIAYVGNAGAAKLFECPENTVKSWRYGKRQPSIKQAKKIIKAADGKLDFESIYGPLETVFED